MKKCSTKGCETDATMFPVIKMWAKGLPKKRENCLTLIVDLPVCDSCCGSMDVADMLTDDAYRKITGKIITMGKMPPDRERAELAFNPIEAPGVRH